MPKKKTGQRKKADKQKARLKEIRNKGNYVEWTPTPKTLSLKNLTF
jgi:hypothetical protein